MTEALAELKRQLELPIRPESEPHTSGFFDPWEIFPCFYGSYNSDFDDMAILVLENIRHNRFGDRHGEGLAHEMFREVLCTADLCDYGTSPRGCFPNWDTDFNDLLPALIAKWRAYAGREWT